MLRLSYTYQNQKKLLKRLNFRFARMIIAVYGNQDILVNYVLGDQLARELSGHDVPVTSLILSNSRISDLTPNSFSPVENSLKILQMDNCSVSLQALSQLTNLRVFNIDK